MTPSQLPEQFCLLIPNGMRGRAEHTQHSYMRVCVQKMTLLHTKSTAGLLEHRPQYSQKVTDSQSIFCRERFYYAFWMTLMVTGCQRAINPVGSMLKVYMDGSEFCLLPSGCTQSEADWNVHRAGLNYCSTLNYYYHRGLPFISIFRRFNDICLHLFRHGES